MRRAVARARGTGAVRCEGGGCSERITSPSHKSAGVFRLGNCYRRAPGGHFLLAGDHLRGYVALDSIVRPGMGLCVKIAMGCGEGAWVSNPG